ncbi:hypothetical protein M2349_001485 [Caldanaerobacter subterraneus subsp. tengcongensis MB4]|nr:hypothetical protein [Caldanaerobacter subterraneus subsp. tengcongensis MB4]
MKKAGIIVIVERKKYWDREDKTVEKAKIFKGLKRSKN